MKRRERDTIRANPVFFINYTASDSVGTLDVSVHLTDINFI